MPSRAISSQNSKNAIELALKDQYRLKAGARERAMKRITFSAILIVAAVVAVLGGSAISAEDKYTLQVPGGLAFSEFRGYEAWSVIAISENGGHIAVIMGNPAMIDAYKEGVPGNGKPFPDGARMAKIHWIPKKQETYPGQPMVPDPARR
jgi:hypothetical protein